MNLNKIRDENLKALKFKNSEQIYNEILKLNDIKSTVKVDDIVDIKADISNEQKDEILQIALMLKPWRKGPFNIFDIFIDSEWQSNIKFNILKPHLNLKDKIVGDIGCNNGYYLFRMLEFLPKKLVGFDPSIRTYLQFLFLNKYIKSDIVYELLGVEHLPFYEHKFDTLFCLGVIYHRSDPIKMLKDLKISLNKNGEVFLDTMYIDMDGDFALCPKNSYSKISNIYFVPTIKALQNWCEKAKFKDFEILATKETDLNEQRKTPWIDGQSLENFLDPNDNSKTIEGYPAPKRVYVKLKI
ncbi:tRNA (cmo5U34)-carboxymethyltransferase [Campylobacter blaseri]|uniref:tRNA 5-methoxyuridine(34)/uridine 5-oxyacetic acid(34) synthase CmoB n=1 Tax=Campylobacter blaseri TaxID=2042961 RepID=A0A2P8R268_9BACT|nr:tRNA 5-methoxyuridine(34)/uridine 5-oxyacetic acid(34) synthase CmoB [Campylobacter blaseri]PSM52578.1 tRNA 5-methoxyuridine(34)/uridine 5-oxyacetic acid(34) synthase CmoB [Campylobacter blaseri]PSM54226.1 tRNA 5-methoxyuridine(34)/uridine 5-oxyacetic acid(34) synthase CmoB [Campylobacter blaseri]QKF85877.1 tRNA (cmo5U34)-carboxymethyltransferase [Campylobacter blaseri]